MADNLVRSANLILPPRTTNLQIDYTALSLAVPEKVRFRYRLEGVDKEWQDAGSRREAFYTRLGPGEYHFRVIACNNDGVWNEEGAALTLASSPAWYQTRWFQALYIGLFLLLLWALYQLRLKQLERQFNVTLQARVDERTRIARDLHDTLLQTLHGLMFQFQAVRNLMPRRPDEAMRSLDEAISDTKEALAESRDAIRELRSEQTAETDLAQLLTAMANELASSQDADQIRQASASSSRASNGPYRWSCRTKSTALPARYCAMPSNTQAHIRSKLRFATMCMRFACASATTERA